MIETSTSIKNIDKKIFLIQSVAPVINKDGVNPHFKSKYAEYPEIQAVIRPLLIDNGILVSFMPVHGNMLTMYVKDTDSAEFYKVTADLNTVGVSPQAQGSAITYLKRYMITAFFDLQIDDASDDDGNAATGHGSQNNNRPVNNQQPQPPAEDKRAWLNKDSQTWFDAKNWLFNKGGSIAKINKKYRISKENAELIAKTELLNPASKMWVFATFYMSKPEAKPEHIFTMFDISDTDMQDLLIDATNSYPVTETANTNTAK